MVEGVFLSEMLAEVNTPTTIASKLRFATDAAVTHRGGTAFCNPAIHARASHAPPDAVAL